MITHTVSSHELARNFSRATRLAAEGPVFITDRGRPAFVLVNIEDFHAMTSKKRDMSLLELMESMPGTEDVEYEVPHIGIDLKVPRY